MQSRFSSVLCEKEDVFRKGLSIKRFGSYQGIYENKFISITLLSISIYILKFVKYFRDSL